jgi:O-antigen/teichoic acid export membrane protein
MKQIPKGSVISSLASRAAFWSLGSQLVTSFGNFIFSVLLIRELGLEQFGRYSLCFLLIMVIRNYLTTMVLNAISSIQPRLKKCSQNSYRGFVIFYGILFSAGSSVFLFSLIQLAAQTAALAWLQSVSISLVAASFFSNAADVMRRYFFVTKQAVTSFFLDFLRYLLQIAVLIFCMHGVSGELSINIALISISIGGAIAVIFGICRFGMIKISTRFSYVLLNRKWNSSKWMLPATSLDSVVALGPYFLVALIAGDAALGVVRSVQQLANFLNLPVNALEQLLPSAATRRYISEGTQALKRFLLQTLAALVICLIFMLAVLLLLFDFLFVKIMTVTADNAQVILVAFGVLIILSLVRRVMSVYFYVRENTVHLVYSNLAAVIATSVTVAPLAYIAPELAVPTAQSVGMVAAILVLSLSFYSRSKRGM